MKAVRLTQGLRSPLAFVLPGTPDAPAKSVGIEFEGREFVWHPPSELHGSLYGPMVATITADDADFRGAEQSLQRLLSALAFRFDVSADSDATGVGGDGDPDPFNPYGSRVQRADAYVLIQAAPTEILVQDDPMLRLALSYYREGLNASSPFYGCLAFRNVLDVVFDVKDETANKATTPEAAARDAFIDSEAPRFATSVPIPDRTWSDYLREEVRNALQHVRRQGSRREANPDDARERVRFLADSRLLQGLARSAIERQWPEAVTLKR